MDAEEQVEPLVRFEGPRVEHHRRPAGTPASARTSRAGTARRAARAGRIFDEHDVRAGLDVAGHFFECRQITMIEAERVTMSRSSARKALTAAGTGLNLKFDNCSGRLECMS